MSSSGGDNRLESLMKSYQNGDRQAFECLFEELHPKILQYLASKAWDRTVAEDLLQETFLQIHRSRATYQPGKPVLPWIFGIARYVFLMYLRSSKKERGRKRQLEPELFEEIPVPPEVEGLFSEDLVRSALRQVSPEKREPLLLHHVWGFSFREVAGLMGIGRSAAKVRSHRAMEELREILGRDVTEMGRKAK